MIITCTYTISIPNQTLSLFLRSSCESDILLSSLGKGTVTKTSWLLSIASSTGRAHGLVNKYLLNLHMIVQTVEHKRWTRTGARSEEMCFRNREVCSGGRRKGREDKGWDDGKVGDLPYQLRGNWILKLEARKDWWRERGMQWGLGQRWGNARYEDR